MNFLLLSGSGDGLGLALKLRFEGNNVVSWIRESHAKGNYEGLIHKTTGWENFLSDDSVILFDSIGGGKTAERLRGKGYEVIGGGLFSDQLEFDLESMCAELEMVGLPIARDNALAPTYGVEAWFDGKKFLPFTVWYLRRTRLMTGDLGPRTPCSGTLVWWEPALHPHLAQLEKLFDYHGYKGPVSLTLDANDNVIDLVARFTWDTLPAFLELLDSPLSNLLQFQPPNLHKEVAAAVRVSQPGYGSASRSKAGQVVGGLTRDDREHFYLYSVALDAQNRLVTTGYRGSVLAATGRGANPVEALRATYGIAERAQFPDRQYRIGLEEEFERDFNEITGGVDEITSFASDDNATTDRMRQASSSG